ncbi:MAG: 3'-5' exonuclease [Patescibacteria group bacterium]|nr:3'-5' exonuclease [Patescibacteria group bacterium]
MFIRSNKYAKLFKMLKLDKPLIMFDIETTGRAISEDKIVEIAYIKIWPNGKMKKDDIIINPQIKISPEAASVHGIRNRDVKDKPKFKEVAQNLWDIFNDCYYGGFNIINFDLMILRREFIRAGMSFEYEVKRIIDSKKIYDYFAPSTIGSAYEYYCRKKFYDGHNAVLHAETATSILIKQLEKYHKLLNKEFLEKIHNTRKDSLLYSTRKFYWLNGEAFFAFSKYKNQPISEIARKDPKFLEWILSSDFSNKTKNVVRSVLKKTKNIKLL